MIPPRAEGHFDTENLFHGYRPEREPSADSAFAALASLLPPGALDRPDATGRMSRVVRDVLDWQSARSGVGPTGLRSYGKTVDSAVRVLRDVARRFGTGYVETHQGTTPDPHHGERPLVDFEASVDLRFENPLALVHIDVPAGRDQAELRLIADLESMREAGALPDRCVIGSGDNRIMRYVDGLPDDVRTRFLIVLPAPASAMRKKVGDVYARLSPENIALVSELRVLAARARQRRSSRRTAHPDDQRPAATHATTPSRERGTVAALLDVDWPTLTAARYGTAAWVSAARSLAVVDAVERSFVDPVFARRFDAPSVRSSISALRDGSIARQSIRSLVTSAVMYDTVRHDSGGWARMRRAIDDTSTHGFLRDAMTRLLPLSDVIGQTP